MQTIYKNILFSMIFLLCATFVHAQENVIISAIKNEVTRNKSGLKIDKLKPPFFINYTVIDSKNLNISASLGCLTQSIEFHNRAGLPTLLVGDYNRNNINFGNSYSFPRNITIEDNPQGIATAIWGGLDGIYKNAAESYEAKLAAIAQQNIEEEDLKLPDLEQTKPASLILEPAKANQDKAYWEDYAKKSSAILKNYPEILQSSVDVTVRNSMIYVYNTESTELALPNVYYYVHLNMFTITDDGQELSRDYYVEHSTFEQMPALQKLIDTIEVITKNFIALRNAPLVKEAYSGPVLFERQAIPEILQSQLSKLFAARKPVAGGGGNTTEMMTGKKLISRSLSIKSLSGTETYKGVKLDGYYPIDIEGVVPDKELVLIENGVLKNMLNGRTPSKKFPNSNGHRRFGFNSYQPAIMPGNIQLISSLTFKSSEMKQKLLDAAKEEDLEYAYIVRGYRGQPFEIYRVFVSDGREELVRGAVLQDFNFKSFKRILGASDSEFIYNTSFYGALVTYIVPDALLFEELDVTRNNNITFKTPFIVPKPTE